MCLVKALLVDAVEKLNVNGDDAWKGSVCRATYDNTECVLYVLRRRHFVLSQMINCPMKTHPCRAVHPPVM